MKSNSSLLATVGKEVGATVIEQQRAELNQNSKWARKHPPLEHAKPMCPVGIWKPEDQAKSPSSDTAYA